MTDSPERCSPREMFGFVVAQTDLPMPRSMHVLDDCGIFTFTCNSVAEGLAWSKYLGGREASYVSAKDNRRYLDEGAIQWHGWSVQIHAHDEPGVNSLVDEVLA